MESKPVFQLAQMIS